jgi:hypothetical protein
MLSLKNMMADLEFADEVWRDAIVLALKEAEGEIDNLPETSPWLMERALEQDFLPD